jgi:uncharacterized protein (TIRG00374 family)
MKRYLLTSVKLVVTVGILYLILRKFRIGWEDIQRALVDSNPWWYIASIGTQVGAIFFSILRWNTLLRAQSLFVPFRHLVGTYLVGRFLGTFTPTGVGLEAYKAYDVARYSQRATESVAVVFIEKTVATFFGLSLLTLLTLPFIAIKTTFLYVFLPFFLALFLLALVLLFQPKLIESILALPLPMKGKIERTLRDAVQAVTTYSRKKGSLLAAMLFGMVTYLFLFSTFYTNGLALGAGLQFKDVLLVGPLTQIASMIPLSIAGVGLREGAFVGLLEVGGFHFEPVAATLSATMWYFVSISVNIFGAILFIVRRTDYQGSFQKEEVDRLWQEARAAAAQPASGGRSGARE